MDNQEELKDEKIVEENVDTNVQTENTIPKEEVVKEVTTVKETSNENIAKETEIKTEKVIEPNVQKKEEIKKVAPKVEKVKKEKSSKVAIIIIVILILIIIGMAGTFTFVIVNRETIFNGILSTSSSVDENYVDPNSYLTATPQEIAEKLKKEGFSYSMIIDDSCATISAHGSNKNNGIYIGLDLYSNDKKSLAFRNMSIDEDGEYTYAYLVGEAKGTNTEKQQTSAENWLKSHNLSKNQLADALEYVYQNKISIAYHNYFKEDDNSNSGLSITLNKNSITLPYHGTYSDELEFDSDLIKYINSRDFEEYLEPELIKIFVKDYSGGKLTVDGLYDINLNKLGEYPITFTVTAENGNTKKVTAKIIVANLKKAEITLDKDTVQVNKGANIDVMSGVKFTSNLSKSEQGHIETEGTIDTNTPGTYTITYTYIPKEGTDEPVGEPKTRTYTVVAQQTVSQTVKQNTSYKLKHDQLIGELSFKGNTFFFGEGMPNSGAVYYEGTYSQSGSDLTFHVTVQGSEDGSNSCNYTWHGKASNGGKNVKITYPNGNVAEFNL